MKKILAGVSVMAFLVVAAVAFAGAPTNVTIDKCQKRKAAVTFNHEMHSKKFQCNTCHHKWNGKGEPQSCFQCHGCKKGEAPKAAKAFHKKCKGCHKAQHKGPTRCNQCHPKK